MVDLAMCNLSHDFFRFKDFILYCTIIGMKLQNQHSTFELILLVTAVEYYSDGCIFFGQLKLFYGWSKKVGWSKQNWK